MPGLQRGHAYATRHRLLHFSGLLWRKTMPFSGDRWLITAYTLPDVPSALLQHLGFPSVPLAPLPPAPIANNSSKAAQVCSAELQGAASHSSAHSHLAPSSKAPALPLGAVNWGSPKSRGGFSCHTLHLQRQVPLPDDVHSASSLMQDLRPGFFMDICCGVSAPLATCMQSLGADFLCVDVLRC